MFSIPSIKIISCWICCANNNKCLLFNQLVCTKKKTILFYINFNPSVEKIAIFNKFQSWPFWNASTIHLRVKLWFLLVLNIKKAWQTYVYSLVSILATIVRFACFEFLWYLKQSLVFFTSHIQQHERNKIARSA